MSDLMVWFISMGITTLCVIIGGWVVIYDETRQGNDFSINVGWIFLLILVIIIPIMGPVFGIIGVIMIVWDHFAYRMDGFLEHIVFTFKSKEKKRETTSRDN